MIKPRNTLVVVKIIEQAERRIGNIVVPTNADLYCEAEVIAVGPGNVSADGGRSETFDLHPGQRVWVKNKEQRPGQGNVLRFDAGISYTEAGEKFLFLEQTSILGIIAEPDIRVMANTENLAKQATNPFRKNPVVLGERAITN
jgi:co-chaperonin GroES (HSP10)